MTGEELKQALVDLGMTRLDCAKRFDVLPETVSRWINGNRKRKLVPGPVAAAVTGWLREKGSGEDGEMQPPDA